VGTPKRTSRRRKITLAGLCVGIAAVTGLATHGWYYDHYEWPRKIQVEVLGEVVVDHSSFRSFEGNAHWGQGMFRWKYTVPPAPGSAWMKYCGSQAIEKCEYVMRGQPEDDVMTYVSYKDGVLTIEEWWM
jgi:hypothetical protein